MSFFLNTYWPLCSTWDPKSPHPYPPFCDGSIRREPDLQSAYPTISALCRASRFAPRLGVGDKIIYMTCKGRYLEDAEEGWRIVAALEVLERLPSHSDAAQWFEGRELPLPGNCMVSRNVRVPVQHTHLRSRGCSRVQKDDREYWRRSQDYPMFLVCRAMRMDLVQPPQILRPQLVSVFGKIPGTESGRRINEEQFEALLARMPAHVLKEWPLADGRAAHARGTRS